MRLKNALHETGLDRLHGAVYGADEIVPEIGDDAAERIGDAGPRRNEDAGDGELARQCHRVQRPGAAKGQKREIARIVAARQRHHTDGARHPIIGDPQDRRSSSLGIETKRAADRLDEPLSHDVERHLVDHRQQGVVIEPAEHEIGVGDRRLRPAAPETDRTRRRPGALRPNPQQPRLVDARDRAAAGADRVDIDHGHMDRHRIFELDLGADERNTVSDQRDIAACPAHVVGHDVGEACFHGGIGGGNDARCRSRHHRVDRRLGNDAGRDGAAVALHDEEIAGVAARAKLGLETGDITVQHGLDRRIHRSGDAALVLAELADQRAAHRDVVVRPQAPRDLSGFALVRGVDIGVEEMDDE